MAILRRIRGPLAAAMLATALVSPCSLGAEQRSATAEDDIKAAFLFNFSRFIDWPGTPADGFRVCTVAEPGFNHALERTLVGETFRGLPLTRLSPVTPEAARRCQILFLGRLEGDRADRWMTAVRGLPVLVVGETRGAWGAGVHLNFVVEDNRVQFDINADAARRAGLVLSSKLLRVARNKSAWGGV